MTETLGPRNSLTDPMLVVDGLKKVFETPHGPLVAVRDVSVSVFPGDIVGLIGPNGAGKSTTMRLLSGALEPTAGAVWVGGVSLWADRLLAQSRMGYLPEVPPQDDDLTPLELLLFHAEVHRLPHPQATAETAAKLTRCFGYWDRPMGDLSKGMKQRVHLACALVHNPSILLLDEPTDGLDPNQKHELRHILKQLVSAPADKAKAVILSTHLLEEAEVLCNRLWVIHRGQIMLDTTPDALIEQGKGDMALAFRVLTTNRGSLQT